MMQRATGSFDVTLTPQPDAGGVGGEGIARMTIDKRFHGDLDGDSKGQMLGVRSGSSGGYVAMERVVGTLAGRSGSFVLQHSSTMESGAPNQSITVVPGSGADGLAGLAGSMTIDVVEGKHLYTFEFGFADAGGR